MRSQPPRSTGSPSAATDWMPGRTGSTGLTGRMARTARRRSVSRPGRPRRTGCRASVTSTTTIRAGKRGGSSDRHGIAPSRRTFGTERGLERRAAGAATDGVKFGIDVAPIGDLADPRAIVQLATAAEAAGWDGLSIWDGLSAWDNVRNASAPLADPFVALAAVATATERLRLILSALVLPRRRPHLVAQACGTLDRLSEGRLVVGAVIGAERSEFEAFGEDPDLVARAAVLDESLDLVDRYLRGETVEHDGPALVARGVRVGPPPIQQPRPPIWLGGRRPRALRRAAGWDGWLAVGIGD